MHVLCIVHFAKCALYISSVYLVTRLGCDCCLLLLLWWRNRLRGIKKFVQRHKDNNPSNLVRNPSLYNSRACALNHLALQTSSATQVETQSKLNPCSLDLRSGMFFISPLAISLRVYSWSHRVAQDPFVRKMCNKAHLLYQKFRIFHHIFSFIWENLDFSLPWGLSW